jgi:hypothetical protein
LVADPYNISARWRNHFSQLNVMLGRQKYMQQSRALVPEPSAFEFEMAVEKLKRHISLGIDQIPTELIKAGGRTIRCDVHKILFQLGVRRSCLRSGRRRLLYLSII